MEKSALTRNMGSRIGFVSDPEERRRPSDTGLNKNNSDYTHIEYLQIVILNCTLIR